MEPGEAHASAHAESTPEVAPRGAVLNQPDLGILGQINWSSLQPLLQSLYEWCQDMRSVLSSGAVTGVEPAAPGPLAVGGACGPPPRALPSAPYQPPTAAGSSAAADSPSSSLSTEGTSAAGTGGQAAFSTVPAYSAAPSGRSGGDPSSGAQEGAAAPPPTAGPGEEHTYMLASGDAMLCEPSKVARHVSQEVKEKIWKGEFVDMFGLINKRLHWNREASDERSLPNWILGFTVYSAVLLEKFFELGPQLSCYQHTIVLAHENYGPGAWLEYDTEFRWLKASDPDVRWDQKEVNCWLRCFTGTRGLENETLRGCGVRRKKNGVCWAYNDDRCARGAANCIFRHACSFCGLSSHPQYRCYQKASEQDSPEALYEALFI